jgi:ribosomal protein S18 acetylase RimI-like enzyme
VSADLAGVLDEDFTVDMAKDGTTGEVLGAVEYVMMKKYLWVDAIAVKEECRGIGIGRALMTR